MARRRKSKLKNNIVALAIIAGAALLFWERHGAAKRAPRAADHAGAVAGVAAPDGYDHDRWGTSPYDQKRTFRAFVVSFDGRDDDDGDGRPDLRGQPEFVAYQINRIGRKLGKGPKRPSWTTDPELFAQGIAPNDATYKNSGYDRGHMCMKYCPTTRRTRSRHRRRKPSGRSRAGQGRLIRGEWSHSPRAPHEFALRFGRSSPRTTYLLRR